MMLGYNMLWMCTCVVWLTGAFKQQKFGRFTKDADVRIPEQSTTVVDLLNPYPHTSERGGRAEIPFAKRNSLKTNTKFKLFDKRYIKVGAFSNLWKNQPTNESFTFTDDLLNLIRSRRHVNGSEILYIQFLTHLAIEDHELAKYFQRVEGQSFSLTMILSKLHVDLQWLLSQKVAINDEVRSFDLFDS